MTARRDSFNEPAHGSVGGKVLLFAAAALAIAATGVLVLSDDLKYLRLGIVAGLWAALTGAFIAARYRRQVAERAEDAAESQERYELELEREIAARREHELEVEAEARRWAEQKANDDLTDLRAELQGLRQTLSSLLGGEFLVERYALRAEASRMRPLPEGGDPLDQPKRLPPAQRADRPEDNVGPAAEREADTDLIDRVHGSTEALPRRAERSPAQAKERLDRFGSVPKPHPTEVSDRWFMPDGLGESEQESDWSPSWQSNRGPASPPRGARPRATSGGTNGRASANGNTSYGRSSANGHAAANGHGQSAGYDPRSTSSQAGGATNYPDTVGQRAAASAQRMQPAPAPSTGRTNSAQSAGGVRQPSTPANPAAASASRMPPASPAAASSNRMPPVSPAAASSNRMPPVNPAAASAGRASPTGSAAQPSARVSPTGQPNPSSSQAYPAAASSSQMYPASQPSSSQMYPASQASSARMSPAAPSSAWPQQGSQADPAGRPNHALASSTQLPPASRTPSQPSQSPAAESYGRFPSVSPVQASATRLPSPGNPAGTSGQLPPAAPPGRIQPTGYVGSGRAPLGPGVPPPMTGANPPPAGNSGHYGYGPGHADPSAAVASGYHGFGPGYGDPAGPAAASGYHDFGPGSGGQNPQALSSGYVPPAEFGPGAGGPVNRRSAESGYVAPVARPNGYSGGAPAAGGRHSGSHALPDADMPSGSHATGRSVSELLASNGGTGGPRRRRRRED